MENLESKKQELQCCQLNIKKCANRIDTFKLAIKFLIGNISEDITDKLIEIAGEIVNEKSSMEFYNKQAEKLEKEING